MSSGADPWNIDYFNFKPPSVKAPEPKARAPKPVPSPEDLFMVQRHALQVLNDIEELRKRIGHDNPHAHSVLDKLETDAENGYKVIRRYLAENVAPAQGDFSA
jgi:hypothetical protein